MISVLLPAYKARFLSIAIDSILNQTFKDFELIIVNDASPDNIDPIVEKYHDKRIKYYKNDVNIGSQSVIKSWNKCMQYATGKYAVMFSDDDIYDAEFLSTMHKLTLKYPEVNLFHSRVCQIDEKGKQETVSSVCNEYEDILDFLMERFIWNRMQFAPDFMFNTKSMQDIGGFKELPLAWGSDDITWFTLAKDKGIVHTNEILCYWRRSNYNISSQGKLDLKLKAINSYENWYSQFKNYLKERFTNDPRLPMLLSKDFKWFESQRLNEINIYRKQHNRLYALLTFCFTPLGKMSFIKKIFYCIK